MTEKRKPEPVYAVTFFDHHSWESLTSAMARELSDSTVITVFGRLIEETPQSIMIESTHVDRRDPGVAGERSVHNTGWNIIKGAIISKTRIGLWTHPDDESV